MQYSGGQDSSTLKRNRAIGVVAALIVLFSSSVGLYLFGLDRYSENQIRDLIEDAHGRQRPGGGRLSAAPYHPVGEHAALGDLGRAQFLLLRFPESETRRELQGQIYLASGEWQKFVENFPGLAAATRRKPEALNNLGASYLALSSENPAYLLKAIDEFERALRIDPSAPEPHFNQVIAYRRLRLPRIAEEISRQYERLEQGSPWHLELAAKEDADESMIVEQLRLAVESGDVLKAQRLFEQNAELYRRVAMEFGISSSGEDEGLVRFIAAELQRRFADRTVAEMLVPLFSDRRDTVVAARDFVNQGAQLYVEGNFQGSLEMYEKAHILIDQTDSLFDRLWIDLNRVDSLIRAGEYEAARGSLESLIAAARRHDLKWLLARALSIYGSTVTLTASYGELMERLSEADRLFLDIGSPLGRVRPLYYLAGYRYGAGDHDEALKLALECLSLTPDGDFIRRASLDWLIGSILYRQGFSARAVMFEKESLEQTQRTNNAALETTVASTLAQLYASMSEEKLAEEYSHIAADALKRVPSRFEQMKAELPLNLVRARISLDRKQYREAESLLEKNLNLYSQGLLKATFLHSQSLMLLAQAYSETDRTGEAAQFFTKAIDLVENDDDYLRSEKIRIKFDDERRDLYDSAIEFEYRYGSPDAAWAYLQRYRAKLFLEFLAQFNPDVERIHTQALNRSTVQAAVGKDTQIVEYALLKDRILIWLISDKLFTLRSVPVSRAEIEGKVQVVLQKLRNDREQVEPLLEDLGKILIEPVANLLEPGRTVAIVPDRALHGLPFAALTRPSKKRYLIQDFPVVVSPSLTHLLATDSSRPNRDKIVGFGSQNGASSEIQEIEALKSIYSGATTVAGRGVNKAGFLAAINTAEVFHYAGHSVTDAADPLRSSILLDGNRYGPNSVTAVDISQQRLPENAVSILSSCDSSVGNSRDGVGVRGLTSAFLIGGAGSVVGSLWPVEASSTADLMIRFHKSFTDSQLSVAKALREAQLAFLDAFPQRSHPYYWSGFVVTGNFSAVR